MKVTICILRLQGVQGSVHSYTHSVDTVAAAI